ncbi:hypothetical protein L198_01291 [Cryptococcus wingfieldii CBS 7118]|uniref:Uncharacterized protein n=1 Tax=Cryptococcus wingfieldii CBS 7118 TaxID=1295528 RepID=A0A1E3K1J2_9TREE|nr:hypothetical protein L198_01291 [Cryptococcus wingfieldii CBS 7118]ODO06062.1 hypothetical protein L198_01291 [Cryptococcus wingfieldii CBS 7118]
MPVDLGQSSSTASLSLPLTLEPLNRCNNPLPPPANNPSSSSSLDQQESAPAFATDTRSPGAVPHGTPTLEQPGSINPNQVPWGGDQRYKYLLGGAAHEGVLGADKSGDENGENGEEVQSRQKAQRQQRQSTSEPSSVSTPSSNATDAAYEQNKLMPRWG